MIGNIFRKSKIIVHHLIRAVAQLAKSEIAVSPDYFISPERVYLASADNYTGLEGLVESEHLLPCKHFYSVIGGMGGLNILCRLENVKTITWFDINPHMLNICSLVLKLISASATREDFISLIYCKPFSQNSFPQENINMFYKQSVSEELRVRLSNILSVQELQTYDKIYLPYTSSFQQEFVLGPCLHCTSLRVYHDAPINGVMTYPFLSREHIQKHQTTNINSFFFGKGWLRSEERFQNVKNLLASAEMRIDRKNIFELSPAEESGLYSSNILDGTENKFSKLVNDFDWMILYSKRTKFLTAEYVSGNRDMIPCEKIFSDNKRNPHNDCCLLLEDIVNISHKSFLEVIHPSGMEGMNSGFRFYTGQKKIHINNYLRNPINDRDISLVILHMLMGNGCTFNAWQNAVEQAINSGLTVCVFEHNPIAGDWPELEVCHWNIPSIAMIDRFLLTLANGWKKYGTLSLTGNGIRNYCWVLRRDSK